MFLEDFSGASSTPRSSDPLHLGMDLGSTTAKFALTTSSGKLVASDYRRHRADVLNILKQMLEKLYESIGNVEIVPAFTGSAGMGLAERTGTPYTQEVVAASETVVQKYPGCRLLVDIGGEDCKMIFFRENCRPDMRMNGNCAGGTGAFIEQMASLLKTSPEDFDALAGYGSEEYTIASRCGVFAKTDIQNLINNGAAKGDIARAVFHAVSCQAAASLARGGQIKGPAVFVGGPLHFFWSLREAMRDVLSLSQLEVILPDESLIFPSYGAALTIHRDKKPFFLKDFIAHIGRRGVQLSLTAQHEPLFSSEDEYQQWELEKDTVTPEHTSPEQTAEGELFLGIDAGSTTTKLVLTDRSDRIVFKYYANNKGEPLETVREGLLKMREGFSKCRSAIHLKGSGVTGYGEELIKAAFELDHGLVETLAHYKAARNLDPHVSFILDVGGQDMKAIYIEEGNISNIEVNEACSSGCGSFIETFAESLGQTVENFGILACTARHPVDLGSRCTVFMNSSVKEALRQGNDVADVAAGLAYGVIQNCLHKVLRIADTSVLGNTVFVQGGTFKNPAVLRAMEKLLGTEVIRPGIAEYMGAYGAAIFAREQSARCADAPVRVHPLLKVLDGPVNVRETKNSCKGCTNTCSVRSLHFPGGRKYYTGNRCERIFTNREDGVVPGDNIISVKRQLLLRYPLNPGEKRERVIGIPMVLNMYENYPFWATFFSELGWRVERSLVSGSDLAREAAATIMSDNICYPAKLAHPHILDLIKKKVDRIFYPRVVFEYRRFKNTANNFNCPVVTGYPDVISAAVHPEGYGVPMDSPTVSFGDKKLLRKACREYVRSFGIDAQTCELAFGKGCRAAEEYEEKLRLAGCETIAKVRGEGGMMLILGGRPYHADSAVNHTIPEMISRMGVHVLPEDALPLDELGTDIDSLDVADQWEYTNRLYRAAHWAGREPLAEFVQLNSFGCGPDAVVIDEVKTILRTYSLLPVVLKIDEITSLGSAKLRVRSLIESREDRNKRERIRTARPRLPAFTKEDRKRVVLVPDFSPFYSFFAQAAFTPMGYTVEILPPPDRESVKTGLKYANNDICYPAIVTIGDAIKALQSGRYNPDNVAVAFTGTGGQCRATNYVSLLKKGLLVAGYDNVPVVSVSFSSQSAYEQPGFSINRPQLISLIFSSLLLVDQLVAMYHATAVREKVRGSSLAVLRKHLDAVKRSLGRWAVKQRQHMLERAVTDFNRIEVWDRVYPKAGLVGEIYVKYNSFSNNYLVNRLMDQGIEVVIPPMISFFLQTFVNVPFNHGNNIERATRLDRKTLEMLLKLLDRKIVRVNELMKTFRFSVEPVLSPKLLAAKAERVLSLANQAGEGWLLPGEIVAMAENGIKNFISLQPFGCIANHVVAKGISQKLSTIFPNLNFLSLDMDAGNSDANIQNRLDFFIHSTRKGVVSPRR